MKKLLAILAVAGVMAACNNGKDEKTEDTTVTTKDTVVAAPTQDTTIVTKDSSTKVTVDSSKKTK